MSLLKKMLAGTLADRIDRQPPKKNPPAEKKESEKSESGKKCDHPTAPCHCGNAVHWQDIAGTWRCGACFPIVTMLCRAWIDTLAANAAQGRSAASHANHDNLDDPWAEPEPSRAGSAAIQAGHCRCGSPATVEVAIHGGTSTRLDCAACGRFVRWGRWGEWST